MTKFKVVGAGMAGLLAGAILREECSAIVEAQNELPNNHSALLRFRSSLVGDAVNISFRSVDVMKAVASLGNPVADALSYSMKTNGTAALRSITSAHGKIEQRFIAPEDFVPRLAKKVTAPFFFGKKWEHSASENEATISTLPMPVLMDALGYEGKRPEFKSVIGYSCNVELRNCDVCATIYIPDGNECAYRASITGSRLIVEYAFPGKTMTEAERRMNQIQVNPTKHLSWILSLFGLREDAIVSFQGDEFPKFKSQKYAKILPISDNDRKRFMIWATDNFGVYSLGRFATWRPRLLMDDLVNDIRQIQGMAGGKPAYETRKA
jgi:hypothetical protein